jgi:tetratricopeptide (TPR) repeat protein
VHAVEQYNAGTPTRALKTLRRALRALAQADAAADSSTDHALVARIWISIALNEAEVRSLSRGLTALGTAQIHAVAADDSSVTVLLHCQRGLIQMRGGSLAEAVSSFDAAVELIEYAEPRDQSSIMLNRGTASLLRGRLKAARPDLQRAAAIARRAGLVVGEFKALHNLAYLEFLAGDLPTALRLMDEAGEVDAPVSRGVWLLDRARVLAEAGLVREADSSLGAASEVFRADGLAQDLGEAELERARCSLLAGDPVLARQYAARARDRFRRRGNDRWRRTGELILLYADLAAGRPGTRLVGPAMRLHAEFERDGLRVPARTAALIAAEAHLSAGRPEAAAEVLGALGRTSRRDPITSRLQYGYVRARLDLARGQRARASRRVRSAMSELAAYQASFGSIDLATAAAIHGRRLVALDIGTALAHGRADEVFQAAEHVRAVISRLSPVRPPEDEQTADLLAQLRRVVEALRGAQADQVATTQLLDQRADLEAQIAARSWGRLGRREIRRAVTLAELSGALHDTVLVSYLRTGGTLHAVVVTSVGPTLFALGPVKAADELVHRVRADLNVLALPLLPAALQRTVVTSLQRSMNILDAMLLEPLGLNSQHVVIVPTGVLAQLPWGELPSLRAVAVTVAPSATAWRAADTPGPLASAGVVAVAGPDLDRAEDEARQIGRIWPGAQVLAGSAATGRTVRQSMPECGILHLAAHGVHQTENPLFSSLRLVDGPLFAHELDQTANPPEHVVLSACELGLATVRPGDEPLGLTSVLLHLGTRSVVAGVARVGDDVAAETMIAYHARLATGEDSATALARAVSEAPGDRPAPFVCFGSSWRLRPG